MIRKDCENAGCRHARSGGTRSARPPRNLRAPRIIGALVSLQFLASPAAWAGTVRVWPTAVVVGDKVRLDDVCDFQGFDADTLQRLNQLVVSDAPAGGGSRIISLDTVRAALIEGGANLAQLTLRGATQCAVSRPLGELPAKGSETRPVRRSGASSPALPTGPQNSNAPSAELPTLRRAVVDYFNREFGRYGGTAELVFDHTSDQVLDLSGPAYEFRIRPRGKDLIGLCPLEIDVIADGRAVQTVPLVVQTTMTRRVVVAKRTINQDATIQAGDVDTASLTFTRLEKLGVDDASLVIGQRAKRVVTAGALIETENLESVPLVLRGQLVTIVSEAAGIRVVTTGKAAQDGRRGDVIKVHSVDDKKLAFDAVVVAPGRVRLGAESADTGEAMLALGGQR